MKLIHTIFLVIITLSLNSQTMEEKRKILDAEALSNVVVNLRHVSDSGVKIGTGILVVNERNNLFIVTAAHVAKFIDKNDYLILSGANDKPIIIYLKDLISTSKLNWKYHDVADLAVLELSPKPEKYNYLKGKFLDLFYFETSKNAIKRNVQLTTIGFPLGLGAQEHFSPLTFRTFASSGLITMNRFDTKTPQTFIILENPSVGGYSGGPVFDLQLFDEGYIKTTGKGTRCIGFIHGTLFDDTGGKLAAVTPAYYLFDLIK